MVIIRGTVYLITLPTLLVMMLLEQTRALATLQEVFNQGDQSLSIASAVDGKFFLAHNDSASSAIKEEMLVSTKNALIDLNGNKTTWIPEHIRAKLEEWITVGGYASWFFQYFLGQGITRARQQYYARQEWPLDRFVCGSDFTIRPRFDPINDTWVSYLNLLEVSTSGYSCENLSYSDAMMAGNEKIDFLMSRNTSLSDNIGFSFNYSLNVNVTLKVECKCHRLQSPIKLYGVRNIKCNNTWEDIKQRELKESKELKI
ncbi:hypothetical protein, no similarity [Maudiozyma saulgeensis]|uniref:Uncharacterized protein n=1 Tax=Maudiozyma saulgeensis TaxID=1789683 RepID=A0A1X7R6M4_9SACH|nr:hypothetical protein, no similarity [Kazachstania saulgeensis]